MVDGGYLSNGLHSAYVADNLPLDHWFHAFQTVFQEMITQGPTQVLLALQGQSVADTPTYCYRDALALYAECFVRPLPGPHITDGDFCDPTG